jgi:PAS domain S-box-containing protein
VVFGVLFYSYTYQWFQPERPWTRRWRMLVNSGVFGGLSTVLMIARMQLPDGAFIDARSVPVALIGLFEGWPAGLLAAVAPAVYRLSWGGAGALPGAFGLVASGLLGGLARRWAQRDGRVGTLHALGLSLAVALVSAVTFPLAGAYALELLERVWPALLVTNVVGIVATARLMRDVVEQARLRTEQTRFRAIIDEASDAICIVDAETMTIVEVNRRDCELSGHARHEKLGRDVREFWPTEPALRSQREAATARAEASGYARAFGLPYRTRSGQIVPVDGTQRIVEHGGHRYIIVIFREAAEREAAEAARRESAELRAVNLLAGAAAHEINNPLAVIMGSLDLLGRRLTDDSQSSKWLEQAQGAVYRITDIVARMARITRLESTPPGAELPPILDIHKSSDPKETK